jgi:hypothetical protein
MVEILNNIPTLATSLVDQKIAVGNWAYYKLPFILDFEGSNITSFIFNCVPPSFITLTTNKELSIAPSSTEIEANYTINLTISDGAMVNQYSMNVSIFIPPLTPIPSF